MKQSNVVRQWDMFIQGIDCRERLVKNCSLLCFSAARGRSSRNLSADYFTAIPAGKRVLLPSISSREDPVRLHVQLIERVFCRSIDRRHRIGAVEEEKRKKAANKDQRERESESERKREKERERKGGRKREADEEERSEWTEESNVCCHHANSCWTAMWKGLVGSSDLTARNLVLDTISIGPGELSQSRGSLRGEREFDRSKVSVV